jgi:hypothetical protein
MNNPFTDIKEIRQREGVVYTYVHGGFKGTDIRFSMCFPQKNQYEGRFFQYLPPAANHEDAAQKLTGGDDRILFALTHGAYYVESNLGTIEPFKPIPDSTITYRSSSAVAELSRKIAEEIYGEKIARPYGYLYGGSGGAYKTIECVENCNSWDGAVPYVNGAPVSLPHNFTIRAHALRVLRHKLPAIIDKLKKGDKNSIFEDLIDAERQDLQEFLGFGFPKGALIGLELLKDGALPMLIGAVKSADGQYFEDYWEKDGYAGADKTSDAYVSRLHLKTKVKGKYVPPRGDAKSMDNTTGVDTNWQRYKGLSGALGVPLIELEKMAENDFFEMGCYAIMQSGKAAGRKVYFNEHNGTTIAVAEQFGCNDMMDVMSLIETGDEILLDNSDYVAITDYHLHAIPDGDLVGYSSCFHADGTKKHPQRNFVVNFTGSAPMTGNFDCKMIVEHTFCDESAFPYQGDLYKKLVYKAQGEKAKSKYRLQYMDNALHDDRAEPVFAELYFVTNLACVYQCLLDIADWVEKGIEPPKESQYALRGGELIFSDIADERGGIQNICKIHSNGKREICVKSGDKVCFSVDVDIPNGCGQLTDVEWSFEGEKDYPVKTSKETTVTHIFEKPGKYIVNVRTYNERKGDNQTKFTQIRNIDRMFVEVL